MEALLLRPLADAFLQVGVPVALLVAAAAWAQVRYGTRALDVLVRHRRAAPALGALLGVTPGCGGAILAGGLWLKGRASYGTAVAALTATMGDASYVILAVDLRVGLVVHGVLLVTGVVTGYVVDALGLDPRRDRTGVGAATAPAALSGRAGGSPVASLPTAAPVAAEAVGGPAPAPPGVPTSSLLLWIAAAVGALVAVPVMLSVTDPAQLAASVGADVWLVLGVAGFAVCAAVFVQSGCRLTDDHEDVPGQLSTALAHGAVETAFVVSWVAVAFVVMAVLGEVVPVDGAALPLAGVVGVVVGALVALIPGCGTQIAFTGLYAAGGLPLPALLANAVAQDGDALLPVLARDRRAAVVTTAVTSVPAVVVGLLALLVL